MIQIVECFCSVFIPTELFVYIYTPLFSWLKVGPFWFDTCLLMSQLAVIAPETPHNSLPYHPQTCTICLKVVGIQNESDDMYVAIY